MGLLSKFKKGGGGFLNGVDGLIVDVQFTTELPGGGEPAADRKSDFTSLFCKLSVREDGSEEPVSTHLFAGSADDFVVSDDGRTLTPVEGASLWGGTAFARFYESLVANGMTDTEVENGEPLDFSHLIGVRAHFVQVKDEEAMKRAAKNASKSRGKINAQGQRKGKDGKYYDQRTLEVSEVHSEGNEVEEAPAPVKTTAAKSAAKTTAKPAGKKAAAVDADAELRSFTKDVVIAVVENAKGGKLVKNDLNTAITRYFLTPALKGDARRDSVRRLAYEDGLLEEMAEEGLIEFDKTSKAQTISIAG